VNYQIKKPLSEIARAKLSNYSDTLSHLLFHRGITEGGAAQSFIAPNYDTDVHDPFLLKDAEKSANRIIHAIENNERIAIYADYDADGIPGAATMDDFFRRIGFKNYLIYIPHRHNEGFGVNIDAVEHLALNEKASLMITIDCGITDVLPISRAKELGIDVIVTDHHEPPNLLPPAFAIMDHKQKDCAYPDKNLCGSGMVFKLIQAILKKNRFGLAEGNEKWLLDLVGMATLSDMVPLTGENRVFAYYGLTVLRKSPRKGIMQLLRKLKINQRFLTEDDIAFMITPRINAASRMGVPMDAFKLLAAQNETDAIEAANHLDKINNERKGVVASLVKEVKKIVHERHGSSIPSVIVLGNPTWRPSLLGLAANSCAEEFNRPVFLWGRDGEDAIKGSCRSEGTSSVVEIMRAVPTGVFVQYGGHHHSGGFAVANEAVHYLELRLNEAASKVKSEKSKVQSLSAHSIGEGAGTTSSLSGEGHRQTGGSAEAEPIDLELRLEDINERLHRDINQLAPFGVGNPKPVFLFSKVIPKEIRIFGKAKEHVELIFINEVDEKVSAISFFGATSEWAKSLLGMKNLKSIDLIASLEKSMFMNRPQLRLRIIDVITR